MILLLGYHTLDQHSHGVNDQSGFLQSVTCALHHLGSLCEAIENVNDEFGEPVVSYPTYAMRISQNKSVGHCRHETLTLGL